MRDRLVALIEQADDMCERNAHCEDCVDDGKSGKCANYLIADHLLANGVIVPPCKVGDTLYVLIGEPPQTIAEFHVRTILFGETHDSIGFANKSLFTIWDKRWYDYFGKTIFITREEAEQALHKNN